jgi:hypothetical protein
MNKITVLAKKNLIDEEGVECFTKGKEYQSEYATYSEFNASTILLNNQNRQHSPGLWLKHFKVIK